MLIYEILILFADSASVVRVVKSSNAVIEGDTFSLTCEVSGNPGPNVTWITVSNDEYSRCISSCQYAFRFHRELEDFAPKQRPQFEQ